MSFYYNADEDLTFIVTKDGEEISKHEKNRFGYYKSVRTPKQGFEGRLTQNGNIYEFNLEVALDAANAGFFQFLVEGENDTLIDDRALLLIKNKGEPITFINGQPAFQSSTQTGINKISLESGFSNSSIYYTLDGSLPSFESALYEGPFNLDRTCTIRALAYNEDFSSTAEADPVILSVLPERTLQISGNFGMGTFELKPNKSTYIDGEVVSIIFIAKPGYQFNGVQGVSRLDRRS